MAFNNYPYTDFHELNIDWILKTVKEYCDKVDGLEKTVDGALDYIKQQLSDTAMDARVKTVLDAMVADGTMQDIVEQIYVIALNDSGGMLYQRAKALAKTTVTAVSFNMVGSCYNLIDNPPISYPEAVIGMFNAMFSVSPTVAGIQEWGTTPTENQNALLTDYFAGLGIGTDFDYNDVNWGGYKLQTVTAGINAVYDVTEHNDNNGSWVTAKTTTPGGKVMAVANIHLTGDSTNQETYSSILDWLNGSGADIMLLIGDTNLSNGDNAMLEPFRAAGYTRANTSNQVTLPENGASPDVIFCKGATISASGVIPCYPYSDHNLVWANLEV